MAKRTLTVVLLIFLISSTALSQQYYAVLISGAGPDQSILNKLNSDLSDLDKDNLACWDDMFTMWKALKEHSYTEENIYVLYRDGEKFISDNPIYKGNIYIDGDASENTVHSFLTSTLKNQMTSNDILFVFTGGHGGWDYYQGEPSLDLYGGSVDASEFASWVNEIPCRKRIVVMAQCMSGAFASFVANGPYPTITLSSTTDQQLAYLADDENADGGETEENETSVENGNKYYHWEFNYHVINAIRNRTFGNPAPLQNPSPDLNSNGGISLAEVFAWELSRQTTQLGIPRFWDPWKLASTTYVNCSLDLSNTRPGAPYNVTISGAVGQHPVITWSANTEPDLAGYKLYRMITPFEGGYNLVATLNNTTTSYTDNGVTRKSVGSQGPWANYFVKAYDSSNRYSDSSNVVTTGCYPPGWQKRIAFQPELPAAHQLFDAFPNPFNPSTTIRYGLPSPSFVRLTIYNTLGQQIALLQEGEQEAGYHEVKFDASGLSSGVYIYQLKSGTFTETKKILLAR